MKHLLSYFIVGLTLLGCTTNELETNIQQLNISTEMGELDNVIYPLSSNYQQNGIQTKAGGDFGSNWESYLNVTLASGSSVATPWNESGAVSLSVPKDFCFDIKKQDGWNIIAHTMFSTSDKGLNYIIFYNKYSGLLKGFYYLEGSTTPNNTAIWNISI